MAVIKSIPSKGRIKNIINYVLNKEKTNGRIISGKNCSPQNAIDEMNTTKELYSKTDGISYHHLIQAFKPGEVDPDLAHEIGVELAEGQFRRHEVLVATHIDKEHIHNHFIINSVSFIDGRKLVSNKETLREVKRESNRICRGKGLSVIKEPYAKRSYTMAEYKLAERGISIWKEQLRAAIDEAKEHSENIVEMGGYLEKEFGIKMKIQNKNLSFLHPEKQKYCRGKKLGLGSTKEEIFKYFERGPEHTKFNKGGILKDIEKEEPDYEKDFRDSRPSHNSIKVSDKVLVGNKASFGITKVGFGIEGITTKISRDIEKEKIRVEAKKDLTRKSKEKFRLKNMGIRKDKIISKRDRDSRER